MKRNETINEPREGEVGGHGDGEREERLTIYGNLV